MQSPKRQLPAVLIGVLALAFAAPASAATLHVSLVPATINVNPGDDVVVEVVVGDDGVPFNAFDAPLRFDPTRLTPVVPGDINTQRGALMTAACFNTFHRFVPTPDSLQITLSLLCGGVSVTGPGTVYRVTFHVGTPTGLTHISFGPSTRFFNAGFFVTPMDTAGVDLCVSNCATAVGEPGAAARTLALSAPRPNPWPARAPLAFAFVQPEAGPVTLTLHDVSGRVLERSSTQWFSAGPGTLTLAPSSLPNGLYFVRIQTSRGLATRSVVVLR